MSSTRFDKLDALPLFGQALVAARLARRAVLAMLAGVEQEAALAACDVIEGIARDGDGWRDSIPECKRVEAMGWTSEKAAALEAVRWALDSAGAAQGAWDFPVDSIVGASAVRCFEAVSHVRRVSALQVAILIAADIDSIGFACSEARINKYFGLTDQVFERLAPCHALTLTEPRRTPEEEFR